MAGPFDFTGQNIEDTYQRIVQVSGSGFCDGTGSAVSIGGSQDISHLAVTGSNVIFNHITASGNISASGTLFADDIRATLPTGQDNSVVILDADGRLKTDEIDGDVFDTGRLAKSFANFDNFPDYSNQVAVWRSNTTLRGYTPITADSDGILIATAFSSSGHGTASFIQILSVDKLSVNGVLIGERIGSETKLGNTADTKTIIQSPKLEVTDIRITGDITGSLDGGTF